MKTELNAKAGDLNEMIKYKSTKKEIMKTKLIIAAFVGCVTIGNAQWNPTDPPATWNINASRTGITKIGPAAGIPVPVTNQFEVETPGGNDGIHILDASGGDPLLRLHNANGAGTDWIFQSFQAPSRLEIYDGAGGSGQLTIETANGYCGIGTSGPTTKLHVESSIAGEAILMRNTGGDASLLLDNGNTIWSTNNEPTNHFVIRENAVTKLHIDAGAQGNVGIGTTSPGSKLHVVETAAVNVPAGDFSWTNNVTGGGTGVRGLATQATSANNQVNIGVEGRAGCSGTGNRAYGVRGVASNGSDSYGGHFTASGGNASYNAGVFGILAGTGAGINAGVVGHDGGTGGYAGYFTGNVFITGALTVLSDRQFKTDISRIERAVDKIMLLKPSTYKFKTGEYAAMSLPKGEQMGLIAQELEEVLPGLVTTVKGYALPSENGVPGKTIPEYKTVNYMELIPLLIASIQEQQNRINQLETQAKTGELSITATGDIQNVKHLFNMETNVPNPFSHETVVGYTLPHEVQNAYLGVYDLTGKQVKTFVITERGTSHITIKSDNLVAGMYIYSVIADNMVVDAKRMIIADK